MMIVLCFISLDFIGQKFLKSLGSSSLRITIKHPSLILVVIETNINFPALIHFIDGLFARMIKFKVWFHAIVGLLLQMSL